MVRIRDAVQFVHDETVSGMNAGKTVEQLMKEIRLPAHLQLSQTHGKVSWAVRSIWEYYATWFHFERTSELYATPLTAIQEDLISVVNMPAAMQLVRRYLTNSEPEKALLLLELLGDEPNSDVARAARLETLAQLERRAQAHANDYELYWLASELDKARAAPQRTAPHDSSKRDVQVD
jgi:alkyl sulfatase BDS1-like metallo-beta-lactamase superfamily hydrolase